MAAINLNYEQFHQLVNCDRPVLVDFWAPWCVYCRKIGPAYDRIADAYQNTLTVAKINTDEEPRLAEEEQIEVIPTLVLYHNGTAIDSIVAPDSMEMIDKFIQNALKL